MVSMRCNNWVRSELTNLGIQVLHIEPGIVEIENKLTSTQLTSLTTRVSKLGMEVLDVKHTKVITEVLEEILKKINSSIPNPTKKFLEETCIEAGCNYDKVSSLFSELKGIDLPQFIVTQRIEKVKEILVYEDWKLKYISNLLDFKNPKQLTRMFKKVTGLTPTYYKKLRNERLANVKNLSTK